MPWRCGGGRSGCWDSWEWYWLAPATRGLPRLNAYGRRLDAAAAAARAGDGRYIASPRVDSYHGIWFELHADLIQLAGRTREDETAAGRA